MRLYVGLGVLVAALVAVAIVFAADEKGAAAPDKFHVVTSFTVIADIAANVAGDAATVSSITKPGAEIHDYQPSPSDILKAQKADLILSNGLNLERWFEKFLYDVKDVPAVVVTKNVEPLSIYEGPYSGKPNPHAWMSTDNALIYVENIRKALVEHDPENAEIYNANASEYSNKISAMNEALKARLQNVPEAQRWLVTSEGAFSYLAKDLGMREAYLWPINADQQGSPQQVRGVIDTVREHNIPVVFSESTVSDRPAKQVAKEAGVIYGGVLYVDSLSGKNGPVPTYLDLLQVTTQTIADGFAKADSK